MSCVDLATTLDQANAMFVCAAGGADWWSLLILGAQAVLVVLAAFGFGLWLLVRR